MISVKNEVRIYEIDGEEQKFFNIGENIEVKSHWNEGDRVILVVGGHEYAVVARDFMAAVHNAYNSGVR